MVTAPIVTRFAPSPTGALHLGHAFSAWLAFDHARRHGGRFLLRLEDIDPVRCRPALAAAVLEDLRWLGLVWEEPVRRQSQHMDDYSAALARLEADGLLYPCFCTRADIAATRVLSAPHGPDGPLYPGTCRGLSAAEVAARRQAGAPYALRLNMAEALRRLAGPLVWADAGRGPQTARPEVFGDVVLARKDVPASYHLAVCVDDALQGVTTVIRGADLFEATHVHRLVQALLDLPVPGYHHHPLIRDGHGRRLAKRDRAITLAALRRAGETPVSLRQRLGLA